MRIHAGAVALSALLSMPPMAMPVRADDAPRAGMAWTLLAGQSTRNQWEDFFTAPRSLDFVNDSRLYVGALSKPVAWLQGGRMSVELEGQLVRHAGAQRHWEANLPVVARWHAFPWNADLRTTAAFGVGPSWSSRHPVLEDEVKGESHRWLAHWFFEITLGAPERDWDVSIRLHHRSTAFGLFGEEGGLNSLVLGLRRSF